MLRKEKLGKKEIEKDTIELNILYDIYDEFLNKDGEPELKIVKKNCRRKWFISDRYNITDIRELPSRKGTPYKNKCEVYHRFENKWLIVEGKFQDIKELLAPIERNKIKGFNATI